MASSTLETIYKPLDNVDVEIRLLTILPAETAGRPLECTLSTCKLADAQYETLSYCWGNANDTVAILLDNSTTQITKNLHAALCQFRSNAAGSPFTIWVDAVCINQADVHERNFQVSIMQRIYTRCQAVHIWIGMDVIASANLLKSFGAFVEAVRLVEVGGDRDRAASMLSADGDTLSGLVTGLMSVLEAKYWSRVWIVQEASLPKSRILHIGHQWFELPSWGALYEFGDELIVDLQQNSVGVANEGFRSLELKLYDCFNPLVVHLDVEDDRRNQEAAEDLQRRSKENLRLFSALQRALSDKRHKQDEQLQLTLLQCQEWERQLADAQRRGFEIDREIDIHGASDRLQQQKRELAEIEMNLCQRFMPIERRVLSLLEDRKQTAEHAASLSQLCPETSALADVAQHSHDVSRGTQTHLEYDHDSAKETLTDGARSKVRTFLLHSIKSLRTLDATDPRDKVYGILGVLPEELCIQTDYNKSIDDVYVQATVKLILYTGSLGLLAESCPSRESLPSWAIDFRVSISLSLWENDFFDASGGASMDVTFDSDNQMRTPGIVTDAIYWVCPGEDKTSLERFRNAEDARRVLMGSCYHRSKPPSQFWTEVLSVASLIEENLKPTVQSLTATLGGGNSLALLSSESAIDMENVMKVFDRFTVFLTRQGRLGLVDNQAVIGEGNNVIILASSNVPFVAVKHDSNLGSHRLQAPCYIEGLMYGEAIRSETKPDDDIFEMLIIT